MLEMMIEKHQSWQRNARRRARPRRGLAERLLADERVLPVNAQQTSSMMMVLCGALIYPQEVCQQSSTENPIRWGVIVPISFQDVWGQHAEGLFKCSLSRVLTFHDCIGLKARWRVGSNGWFLVICLFFFYSRPCLTVL